MMFSESRGISHTALQTPRPFGVIQVAATATIVVTARDDADYRIETLFLANISGSTAAVDVHIVPDGGSASAANKAFALTIAAGAHIALFSSEASLLLPPGSSLVALADADVRATGWGYVYRGVYA